MSFETRNKRYLKELKVYEKSQAQHIKVHLFDIKVKDRKILNLHKSKKRDLEALKLGRQQLKDVREEISALAKELKKKSSKKKKR